MKTANENMEMYYRTIVASVVNKAGGFREKDVLEHEHTIEKGETWNDEHKVLNILCAEPEEDGYQNGFSVDIVTRSICG